MSDEEATPAAVNDAKPHAAEETHAPAEVVEADPQPTQALTAEEPLAASSQPEPEPEVPEPAAADEPVEEKLVPEETADDAVSEPEPEPEPAVAAESEAEPEPVAAAVATAEPEPPAAPESKKKWYVVKVQSGREESIKAAVERKVKIENFEEFYGQIAIPVEEVHEKKKVRVKVKDKKTGEVETVTQERNVVKHKKKYPGYLFAEVEYSADMLSLFRETSGVGDFVGASLVRAPTPMTDSEVQAMLTGIPDPNKKGGRGAKIKVKLDFEKGDKVKVRDGAFAGSEGEVTAITEPKDPSETPKVTVVVTIWGRPVELADLDYWHVDKV